MPPIQKTMSPVALGQRSVEIEEAEIVVLDKFALLLPSGWNPVARPKVPGIIASKNRSFIRVLGHGEVNDSWVNKPPRLRRDDLPSTVENLQFGGQLISHVLVEDGKYIREGFVVGGGRYLHFEASTPRETKGAFNFDRSRIELMWILRNVRRLV